MKRKNFYISFKQEDRLNELSMLTGIRVSELMRRAIDEYLIAARRQIREDARAEREEKA